MEHLEYIRVPIDMLHFGVTEKEKIWWNFDRMLETWKILDEFPDTPIKSLPLYEQDSEINEKIFGLKTHERTFSGVKYHRDMYFDIRDNGYDYEKATKPIIVRIKENGVINVGNGHHRVSILKYL